MSRRRGTQSGIDSYLESQGVSPSGGRAGVLGHLTPEEFEQFRKLQRIGTKDPASRAKFDRRSRRFEYQLLNEHAFIKGERFKEPEFYEWYQRNPGSDGLAQVEKHYFKDVQSGTPLSFIAEDLRGFRKSSDTFAMHFGSEEINHILRHMTAKALRESKLGSQ